MTIERVYQTPLEVKECDAPVESKEVAHMAQSLRFACVGRLLSNTQNDWLG